MPHRILRLFMALLFTTLCLAANAVTPGHEGERLFHIARSLNRNLVCYDVQLTSNGLDLKHPVHVYWHNRESHPGRETEISTIERKLAYGYNVKKASPTEAIVTLTAYPKRPVRICKREGKWVALITIDGHECLLTDIYVKTKTSITVDYIELHGKALKDGAAKKEIIRA